MTPRPPRRPVDSIMNSPTMFRTRNGSAGRYGQEKASGGTLRLRMPQQGITRCCHRQLHRVTNAVPANVELVHHHPHQTTPAERIVRMEGLLGLAIIP